MIEQGLIVAGLILLVLLFVAVYFRRWIAPKSLSNRLLVGFMGVAGISVLVVVGFVLLRIDTILTERTGSEYVNLASTNSERLAEQLAVQAARIQQLSRSSGVVSQSSFQTRSLDAMSPEQRTTHIQQREVEWSDPESPLHGMLLWNYAGLDLNALMSSFPIFAQLILTDAYGGLAGRA